MTEAQWMLVLGLAVGTYAIRLGGLVAGDAISRRPRLRSVLGDLPGCLVVGLVAASLSDGAAATWLAAAVTLGMAAWSNHVVATMVVGVGAYVALGAWWS